MNNIDMIILNGVKSQAKCAYDHTGREARRDYIAVRESMLNKVSTIKYVDCREDLENDHILISVHVQHDMTQTTPTIEKEAKDKRDGETEESDEKGPFLEKFSNQL